MLPLFAERVGPAGGRRGALHLRLGPRLPARLPAHRATCSSALPAGVAGAVHDRDGQRPRGRRRRRAARASAARARCAPTAGRWRARACASRSSSCPRPADRLAWLATHLPRAAGLGHRLHAHQARRRAGRRVADARTASPPRPTPARSRPSGAIDVEERLLRNELKAVVATSALGHGLRQARPRLRRALPGARLGRSPTTSRSAAPAAAIERADVVLLRGAEDRRIQDFFIEQAFPRARARRARARARSARRRTARRRRELMADGQPRPRAARGDAEGARRRGRGRARRHALGARAGSDWTYDAERYAQVTALRRAEQAAMAAFGADGRCLMRALQEELDDPDPQDCGRCAVCAGAALRRRRSTPSSCARRRCTCARGRSCSRSRRWRPTPSGAMRKIPEDVRAEEGRALARLGDGGWDPLVQAGRRAGRFDDELVDAAAEAVRALAARRSAWVAAVPSRRTRRRSCPDFARRLAAALGAAVRGRCSSASATARRSARWPTRPSRSPTCAARSRVARRRCRPGPCLLVDDMRFSGWTLAMVAGQLRRRGAGAGLPARAGDGVLRSTAPRSGRWSPAPRHPTLLTERLPGAIVEDGRLPRAEAQPRLAGLQPRLDG